MCTEGGSTWHSVCHVHLNIRSAWLTESQSPTPYSSVPIRTSPFYTAHTMCSAQCAPPANRTRSHVLRKFHGTWLTRFPVLSPVFLVFPVFPVGLAHSIGSAQCAPPANRTRSHVLRKFHSTWLSCKLDKKIAFPGFIVFPVGRAPTMCIAQSASPP